MRLTNDADGFGVMTTKAAILPASLCADVLAPPTLATSESVAGPTPAPDENATDWAVPPLTEQLPVPPA